MLLRKNSPGLLNILSNLDGQFFWSWKFPFATQTLNEIHTDGLFVYVLLKIKNMDFHTELPILKGRAVSDIGNPPVSAGLTLDSHGINPCFGAEFIVEVYIGRGETKKFAAPIPAVDHLSPYLIVTAQQFPGFFNVSVHDEFTAKLAGALSADIRGA